MSTVSWSLCYNLKKKPVQKEESSEIEDLRSKQTAHCDQCVSLQQWEKRRGEVRAHTRRREGPK